MAEVPLQVVITANSAAIKKALKGIQKDILGTETKTRKEIEKTDRARSRSLQKTKAGAQSLGNEFKKAGAVAQRELEKGILTGTKRGIQKAGSFLRRNRGNFIKGLGAITGAGLITARQGFQTARGITGAPTIQQNLANAKQFEMRMAVLQNQAQLTGGQRANIQGKLVAQGAQGTLSPSQLLAGVEAVQRLEGADAIPSFLASIEQTAMFAEGLGADFEGLSKLSTILERQFGILPDQMGEAIGLMAEAGVQGSVEIENFAQQFPRVMGVFAQMLGRGGLGGAQEFAAVSQAVATMFPDAPEQASRATRALVMQLSKNRTQGVLATRGLDVRENTIPEIAKRLVEQPLTDKQMEKAFPETLARSALVALMSQYKPGADNVIDAVLNAGGRGQLERARANTGNVRGTQLGQDLIRANTMQAMMLDNFKGVSEAARKLTKLFDELAATFPGSALIGESVATFLGSLGALTIAMRLASGSTSAKAAVDATSGLTTGVASGGGAWAAAKFGVKTAAKAAAPLAAGYFGMQALDAAFPNALPNVSLRKSSEHYIFGKNGLLGADLKEAARELKEGARANHRSSEALAAQSQNTGRQEGGL